MSRWIADEIWQDGWFQAFLDNPERIPKNIKKDWDEMMEISDRIQPKVDKLIEKYPYKGLFA